MTDITRAGAPHRTALQHCRHLKLGTDDAHLAEKTCQPVEDSNWDLGTRLVKDPGTKTCLIVQYFQVCRRPVFTALHTMEVLPGIPEAVTDHDTILSSYLRHYIRYLRYQVFLVGASLSGACLGRRIEEEARGSGP